MATHDRSTPNPYWWASIPGILLVVGVYLVPLGVLLSSSLTVPHLGIHNFQTILSNAGYLKITLQSITMSALAASICLVLGYPVAYATVTSRRQIAAFLTFGVVASQLMSVLVRTFSWQIMLGSKGVLASLFGTRGLLFTQTATIVGMVAFLMPYMVLPLTSVMRSTRSHLLRASSSLGAGPARTFTRIFLPLSMTGILVGTVLSFVYGVGSYVIPIVLGGQKGTMLGVSIRSLLIDRGEAGLASALAVILIGTVLLTVAIYQRSSAASLEWLLLRSGGPVARVGRDVEGSSLSRAWNAIAAPIRGAWGALKSWFRRAIDAIAATLDDAGFWKARWVVPALGVAVVAALLLPQLVVVPISFSGTRTLLFPPPSYSLDWYLEFFTPEWLGPALTSVVIGVAVAVVGGLTGALAGVAVGRSDSGRFRITMIALFLVPLIVPRVVAGAAIYQAYINVGLVDSHIGLILAHSSLVIPFSFAITLANVQALNRAPELAAASLGSPPIRVLRTVILPQIRSGMIVGMLFAFLISFDEAVISVFLTGVHLKTLPVRMFEAIAFESNPTIGVVATVSLAAGCLVGLIMWIVQSRKRKNPNPIEGVANR